MNIKIDYKNKLHSIGKDIRTLHQIAEAIKARYPGDFKYGVIIAIIDNGNHHQVKSFDEIVDFWKKNGSGASVKIKVFEAPENTELKQEIKQIILQSADPTYTESVYEGLASSNQKRVPEKSMEFDLLESQQSFKLPSEKITNPFLKNKDLDESMEVTTSKTLQKEAKEDKCFYCGGSNVLTCKMCNDSGVLGSNTPFFKAVDQIVENRVKTILKQYGLAPKLEKIENLQKVEVVEEKRQSKKGVESLISEIEKDLSKFVDAKVEKPAKPEPPKEYKVKFTVPPLNHIKCQPNANYIWKVNFTNCGTTVWPKTVSVYKTSNKMVQITEVKPLSPGQSTQITLNLIAPSAKGVESREFRLGYIDESSDNLKFFGPKFGFELEVKVEQKKVPIVQNRQQQDAELVKNVMAAAKQISNQRHPILVLVKQLKSMGVDCGAPKDMLVDIIAQLQSSKLN